jgi:hypothetical protein
MSWFTQALDTVGINNNTAKDVYNKVGGGALVNEVQAGVKEACKQGAIVGMKDYAIPIVLGVTITVASIFGIGFLAGKHTEIKRH